MNTGTKLRATSRTCVDARSTATFTSGATRSTTGTCTMNCSALPATDPHASRTARRGSSVPRPNATSVPIIARFHTIGAAYDSRNFPWLFSTPRHHADSTSSPAPGNRIRTTAIVSARLSPVNPGAITAMRIGVANTPTSTIAPTTIASSAATAPATRSAVFCSPRATSAAYTGMNEADSAPSPNRFCRKFGMRNAALNASAASDCRPK